MRRPGNPAQLRGPGGASLEGTGRGPLLPLGEPAAWLKEGGEACSSADRVFAGSDVAGGEVVEGEA